MRVRWRWVAGVAIAVGLLSGCGARSNPKKVDVVEESGSVDLISAAEPETEKPEPEQDHISEASKLAAPAFKLLGGVSSDDRSLGKSRINQAIEILKKVPEGDANYTQAQALITEYEQKLNDTESPTGGLIQSTAIPREQVPQSGSAAAQTRPTQSASELAQQLPDYCNQVGQAGSAFPNWLTNYDGYSQKQACQTEHYLYENLPTDKYSVFAYADRFAVRFRDWPYTLLADNKAEWTYVDCKTGWTGKEESRFSGESSPFEAVPINKASNPDIMRGICSDVGIQAGF